MKFKLSILSFFIVMPVSLAMIGITSLSTAAPKPGPKANAPAVELAGVVQKWISQKKKGGEIESIVNQEFIRTWQRVNIIGTVKGTTKVMIAPRPGLSRKEMKNLTVHKMEYIKKGEKTFEFYVLLPEGETYPDGDRLKITDAYIESNRGYGVRYGVKPVLIGGKVEQLPPD